MAFCGKTAKILDTATSAAMPLGTLSAKALRLHVPLPKHRRVLATIVSEPAFRRAASALGLQAKNLKNWAIYIIRHALFALKAGGTLKPDATPEQVCLISIANQVVQDTNAMRKACPAFEWRKGPSMGVKTHWASPKDGLAAMNLGHDKRASEARATNRI